MQAVWNGLIYTSDDIIVNFQNCDYSLDYILKHSKFIKFQRLKGTQRSPGTYPDLVKITDLVKILILVFWDRF